MGFEISLSFVLRFMGFIKIYMGISSIFLDIVKLSFEKGLYDESKIFVQL